MFSFSFNIICTELFWLDCCFLSWWFHFFFQTKSHLKNASGKDWTTPFYKVHHFGWHVKFWGAVVVLHLWKNADRWKAALKGFMAAAPGVCLVLPPLLRQFIVALCCIFFRLPIVWLCDTWNPILLTRLCSGFGFMSSIGIGMIHSEGPMILKYFEP